MGPELSVTDTDTKKLFSVIAERLVQGKRVRRTLPFHGRVHIDRPLPFLVVYRRPAKRPDSGTDRLVKGEASYLIASGSGRFRDDLSELVLTVVRTLTSECKAFLIIEIWSSPQIEARNDVEAVVPKPAFRIVASRGRTPTTTIEALENALQGIKILRKSAAVEVVYRNQPTPVGLPGLISVAEAKRLNCHIIGLEVEPIYRNPATGDRFPIVLRNLHRGLSRAFKQAAFEFSHAQTAHRPPNYQALGRRAVVKAVWEVDKRLAEVSSTFDFLLQVTPVNSDQAWTKFKRGHAEQPPVLFYRPGPVDPAMLKRRLYEIPIERIEDPTLALVFREKRRELDRQLSMLLDRGSSEFLYGSLQLYGGVSDKLVGLAETLLKKLPRRGVKGCNGGHVKAVVVAEQAMREIAHYRQLHPSLSAKVHIRDDTVGLMVSRGNLLIGKRAMIPAARVEALLHHEVGTHILTYFNGRAQPFKQLYSGLAGYEALQEGLAVLAEYLVDGLTRARLRLLAGRVVAVRCLTDGATFVDTFRELSGCHGFKQRTAFGITLRVYRGGGLTKDAVYLRGFVELLKYLQKGGDLDILYVGKFAADHIPIIRELLDREVLQSPPLRPRYLNKPEIAVRLQGLRDGISVLNLFERG